MRYRKLFAGIACILNTCIFATYYAVSKQALEHIEPVVFTFLTLIALLPIGLALLLLTYRQMTQETVQWGTLLGSLLCLTLFTTVISLRYTTATSTSFFPSLSGILAALIAFLVLKEYVPSVTWLAGFVSVVGTILLLLSAPSEGAERGNVIALLGAFFFTVFIFAVDQQAKRSPTLQPWSLLGIELLTLATEASFLALLFGNWEQVHILMPSDLYVIAYIALAGTLLPMLVFTFLQKYLSPITVSFLSVLEPVLGAIAAYVLLGETLPVLGYVGGFFLVIGTAVQVSKPVLVVVQEYRVVATLRSFTALTSTSTESARQRGTDPLPLSSRDECSSQRVETELTTLLCEHLKVERQAVNMNSFFLKTSVTHTHLQVFLMHSTNTFILLLNL